MREDLNRIGAGQARRLITLPYLDRVSWLGTQCVFGASSY